MSHNPKDEASNYAAIAVISFLEKSLESGLDDLPFIKDVLHITNQILSEEYLP